MLSGGGDEDAEEGGEGAEGDGDGGRDGSRRAEEALQAFGRRRDGPVRWHVQPNGLLVLVEALCSLGWERRAQDLLQFELEKVKAHALTHTCSLSLCLSLCLLHSLHTHTHCLAPNHSNSPTHSFSLLTFSLMTCRRRSSGFWAPSTWSP